MNSTSHYRRHISQSRAQILVWLDPQIIRKVNYVSKFPLGFETRNRVYMKTVGSGRLGVNILQMCRDHAARPIKEVCAACFPYALSQMAKKIELL